MVAPFQPVVWWNWRQCHLVPSTVLPSRLPFRRSNDFLWRISAITIKITLVTEFLSMLTRFPTCRCKKGDSVQLETRPLANRSTEAHLPHLLNTVHRRAYDPVDFSIFDP